MRWNDMEYTYKYREARVRSAITEDSFQDLLFFPLGHVSCAPHATDDIVLRGFTVRTCYECIYRYIYILCYDPYLLTKYR